MPLTAAARNVMLTGLAGVVTHLSLHTADPGTSGGAELTGGTPAYARQPVTWTTPVTGGDLDNAGSSTFNVPSGQTVTHFGMWSAASGGTFYGGGPLSAQETYVGPGTYTLTDADVTLP